MKAVRDTWKSDAAALQQAEAEAKAQNLQQLKNKVSEDRRLMEVILAKTMEHGHRDIIEKYVRSFYLFLLPALFA